MKYTTQHQLFLSWNTEDFDYQKCWLELMMMMLMMWMMGELLSYWDIVDWVVTTWEERHASTSHQMRLSWWSHSYSDTNTVWPAVSQHQPLSSVSPVSTLPSSTHLLPDIPNFALTWQILLLLNFTLLLSETQRFSFKNCQSGEIIISMNCRIYTSLLW